MNEHQAEAIIECLQEIRDALRELRTAERVGTALADEAVSHLAERRPQGAIVKSRVFEMLADLEEARAATDGELFKVRLARFRKEMRA